MSDPLAIIKDIFNKARNNNEIKILYSISAKKYFDHNVELWIYWLNKLNLRNILIVYDINQIKKTDICIIIGHPYKYVDCDNYIMIQTENFVTMCNDENSYSLECKTNTINMCENAKCILDYSNKNIELLKKITKNQNYIQFPIMLSWNLRYMNDVVPYPYENRDIDIIVATNTYRRCVLVQQLNNRGLRCVSIFRDKLFRNIGRAKIFLNFHAYHEKSALEIHRLCDVVNMPTVIISEKSEDDELEKLFPEMTFINTNEIVEICEKICRNRDIWKQYMINQINNWNKSIDNLIENSHKIFE